MPTVVLIGTLDTKGAEFDFIRKRLKRHGVDVILVDAGILGAPQAKPNITREEVARAAGADLTTLAAAGDRGAAVMAMARGAAEIAKRLYAEKSLDGIMGMGGSGNSSIAAAAMRELPVGVPKLIVSTLASGDTRPYVGATDVTMMYSVVDIAGINRFSERILSNAAAAIAGMATAYAMRRRATKSKPLIGATMFGVTTPCVNAARAWLEERGYEVLVFHATGTGGQSMEALVKAGFLAGVLDITTTELADELVGGVLSAGPERLEAAGKAGVPQVVSLGALDMVNFGPPDTVPEKFRGRNLYRHNATVTLMRTTAEECAELGRIIARKLNMAVGPTAVFIPLKGVSMIATEGKPFYDPEADAALIRELKANLRAGIPVREMDMDINDPRFAQAMARELDQMITGAKVAGKKHAL
ncbi:MAG: Tm-1-like ATP-binding domain-containing protein [Thermoflexales bacterium]|nr:Tm-1-like ATP-binding domain-containing protein [Thermoflexales bacterium]MDW8350425.1 Tm-1-like ATP-binding domain-containing protein [Anaerolineae bacterium]